MSTTPSNHYPRSLRQLGRDAKRLSQAERIPLHEARDRIAQARHFEHWKHMEATLKNAEETARREARQPIDPMFSPGLPMTPENEADMAIALALVPEPVRIAYRHYFTGNALQALIDATQASEDYPDLWQAHLLSFRLMEARLHLLPGDHPERMELFLARSDMMARAIGTLDAHLDELDARIAREFVRVDALGLLPWPSESPNLPFMRAACEAMGWLHEVIAAGGLKEKRTDAVVLDLFAELAYTISRLDWDDEASRLMLITSFRLAGLAGNAAFLVQLTQRMSPGEKGMLRQMANCKWEWAEYPVNREGMPPVLAAKARLDMPLDR